ncbi:MAG TPA: HEAT repeat domain-containing protein [Blastocatellia bacterium]|nr:HEAT repeat domain-containing protein [Blastocatellia bacterium]
MIFVILVIVIVAGVIYVISGERRQSLNEKLYLRRRGYEPPPEVAEGPPVSKDARLFGLIQSLSDISPYARQRAAEDLSRIDGSGQRDPRVLSSLIAALDDSDASVRGAVAKALGKIGDNGSIEPLKRRLEFEESIHVRALLDQALEELG